jgi:SPP1 gp7 family putative phage head morphogenesis protein
VSDSDVYDLIEQFRRELLRKERAAASQMVRAYGQTWQRIQDRLKELDAEYKVIKAIDGRPSWEWIYESNRLKAFRAQVERELSQFAEYAEQTVRAEQQAAIGAAGQQAQKVVKAMVGTETGWNAFDPGAVEALVGLSQADSPLHQLLLSIQADGAQGAEDALVQGMLLGQNPRDVAGALKSALGIGLSRALTIARTETLRAHREATRASYRANNDLVGGWIWHSAADGRTCGCCWAMHGTEHKLDEELNGHPNCRCAMVPVLKLPEWMTPPPGDPRVTNKGVDLFAKLPADQQIRVLGPAKWMAWKDGKFTLTDLVGVRESPVWGSMRVEKSLAGMVGKEIAEQYYPRPGGKTSGFTWFRGELPNVESAIRIGESDMGWVYHEGILREDYLPKFHLVDDVEYTLGLWGNPEPSFNLHVTGSTENIVAFARKWGQDYNQEGMVMLLPTQAGKGGALSWDFGRELTNDELDRLLGGIMSVNAELQKTETSIINWIGVTVRDHQSVEFWVRNDEERRVGLQLIRTAIKRSGLELPRSRWEGGYNFQLFAIKIDY